MMNQTPDIILNEIIDDTSVEEEAANEETKDHIKENTLIITELQDKLMIMEKKLRKKTNTILKTHDMVKDFHFYKNK